MLGKVKDYIVEFTLFGKEPLHIVMHVLIDDEVVSSAYLAVQPILELIRDGYVDCYGNKYKPRNDITAKELIKYIKINEPYKFEEYPSREYYLKATDKGMDLFPDKWEPLSSSDQEPGS